MTSIFWISFAALWLLVVFQGIVLLGVTRGLLLVRGSGSDRGVPTPGSLIGTRAPAFRTRDHREQTFDSSTVSGRSHALLFVSPGCAACTLTLAELKSLAGKARGDVYLVCRGTDDECRALARSGEDDLPMLLDASGEISDLYRISAVPTAVLIDEHDVIQTFGSPMRDGILARVHNAAEETAVAEV